MWPSATSLTSIRTSDLGCLFQAWRPVYLGFARRRRGGAGASGVIHFDIGGDLTGSDVLIATEVFEDREAMEREESAAPRGGCQGRCRSARLSPRCDPGAEPAPYLC
jgi:hypothetical protein